MHNATLLIVAVLALGGCNTPSQTQIGGSDAPESSTTSTSAPQPLPGSHNLPSKTPTQRFVVDVEPNAKIGGVVRSILQDSRGVLWVGGEGDLFRNDGKTLTSYDLKDDLGNEVTVKQIIQDKNGAIWCGTGGGISRIDGETFTSFGEKDGLLSRDVWSLAADRNGTIWIGTIDGVFQFDGKTFTEFPLHHPSPTRQEALPVQRLCIAFSWTEEGAFGLVQTAERTSTTERIWITFQKRTAYQMMSSTEFSKTRQATCGLGQPTTA